MCQGPGEQAGHGPGPPEFTFGLGKMDVIGAALFWGSPRVRGSIMDSLLDVEAPGRGLQGHYQSHSGSEGREGNSKH